MRHNIVNLGVREDALLLLLGDGWILHATLPQREDVEQDCPVLFVETIIPVTRKEKWLLVSITERCILMEPFFSV